MIYPKLTKKTLEELLDSYAVTVEWKNGEFIIYPKDTMVSGSLVSRLVSICKVFGYDFYVSNKVNGELYLNLF